MFMGILGGLQDSSKCSSSHGVYDLLQRSSKEVLVRFPSEQVINFA